jgi:hypothetical protein
MFYCIALIGVAMLSNMQNNFSIYVLQQNFKALFGAAEVLSASSKEVRWLVRGAAVWFMRACMANQI